MAARPAIWQLSTLIWQPGARKKISLAGVARYVCTQTLLSKGRKAYAVCKLNATYTFLPLDSRTTVNNENGNIYTEPRCDSTLGRLSNMTRGQCRGYCPKSNRPLKGILLASVVLTDLLYSRLDFTTQSYKPVVSKARRCIPSVLLIRVLGHCVVKIEE